MLFMSFVFFRFFWFSIDFPVHNTETNLSSLPIDTASPLIPRTHLLSHSESCGHTHCRRSQASAEELTDHFVSLFDIVPSLISAINAGIFNGYRTS